MTRKFTILLLSLGMSMSSSTITFAAPTCSPVIIKTVDKVRSQTVKLWEQKNGKFIASPTEKIDIKKPSTFPLTMMDCGDSEHYFLRRNNAIYMVKKAKFLCIAVSSTGRSDNGGAPAGAPGLGNGNAKC